MTYSEGLTADMYLMDWHLSLFAKCLPLEVVVRIWDIYFGYIYPDDGEIYLLRLGLGLLQMHSNKLLSLQVRAINIKGESYENLHENQSYRRRRPLGDKAMAL